MTRGFITKIVSSYGATWGRISVQGESRDVFFNAAALDDPSSFPALEVGQEVEYSEQPDPVNGSRAEHIVLIATPVVG
ncbi:MAG TPA: hypothetical protein VFX19_00870 [Dehalococcoidia bacterium]|jgi:cold shock CspA family protein|nr:hypothetical protein [Dehalococcoidia bacterium]